VSCWYTLAHNTVKVVVHNVSSSTPLWTYDYALSSGVYYEGTSDIDITDDGSYFIVGTLGDDANLNPEVHIFSRDSTPHIYYTVDMPGSMLSVDIMSDGSYATACGKHIHAHAMGRGGDIVMINTDITGIANTESIDHPGVSSMLEVYPNPFHNLAEIRFSILDTRYSIGQGINQTQLRVYDAAGRCVKTFSLESIIEDQESSILWSGVDDANRVLGCGVYFVELETQDQKITRKVIKLN
jgi:hypothetical protein